MRVALLGLSHKTAPLEVRERLAWAAAELPAALRALREETGAAEAAILSTCNRTEIYAAFPADFPGEGAAGTTLSFGQAAAAREAASVRERLLGFYARAHGWAVSELEPHCYFQEGLAAARHLFRVAGGLDSLVVGETQVLGQVREAYRLAQEEGCLGPALHALFSQALGCGKRIHTETAIGRNAASVSYAAVELARKIFGDLTGRSAMLVGAGEMAELTARHLRESGVDRIWVANRTLAHAAEVAATYGGRPISLDEIPARLVEVDVVVSSTGAPGLLLGRGQVQGAMRRRRQRPLLLIDIAFPRDIDPAVAGLDNVYLYAIDDLEAVVEQNLAERVREAERAEVLVDEELEGYRRSLEARQAAPLIAALRERAERVRKAELERLLHRLPDLGEREVALLERFSRQLVAKLLHAPMRQMKDLAGEGEGERYAAAFRLLFALDGGASPASGDREGEAAAGGRPFAAGRAKGGAG